MKTARVTTNPDWQCTVNGCDRIGKRCYGGLCTTHDKHKRNGVPLLPFTCEASTCSKEATNKGYCKNHGRNFRLYGTPEAPPRKVEIVCEGPDCRETTTVKRRYCTGHKHQFSTGKPLTPIRHLNRMETFNESWAEDENGCHIWTEGINKTTGYGHFYIGMIDGKNTQMAPHRWIWGETHPGEPLPQHVCHRCDVPTCVNPEHLYAGTAADNMADRDARGRHQTNVLNYEIAQEIRARCTNNADIPALATEYGVHNMTIYNIVKGRTYRKPNSRFGKHLKPCHVLRLRLMWATGEYSRDQLSELFDLHRDSVYQIASRRTFKNIP